MPPHEKHWHPASEERKPHEEILEWLEAIYEKVKNIEDVVKR